MKFSMLDLNGNKIKEVELPKQFEEEYRPDLIKRAVISIISGERQPYGSKKEAGMRSSSKLSRRRRKFKGAYGKGISRVPRKTMTRRGTQFFWVGATAPHTVGGRRAHPPKAEKIWKEYINIKERRKAIRSALAASMNKELVITRGHKIKNIFPIIFDAKIEDVKKTKDIINLLDKVGLNEEMDRISIRRVRSGVGKNRGRKYKNKIGPLFIVSKKDCNLLKSSKNIPGCDAVIVNNLNAKLLSPNTVGIRLCIWSEAALEKINKECLFL